MNYPSIPCLFNRFPKEHPLQFAVDTSSYSQPEFHQIDYWLVTEKVDGMNISVYYHKGEWEDRGEPSIIIQGREEKSIIYPALMTFLMGVFTSQKTENALFYRGGIPEEAFFFLEGYGPGIQKRGKFYRNSMSAVLFDVWIPNQVWTGHGLWLNYSSIKDIARKLGIEPVPNLGTHTLKGAIEMARRGFSSVVATFNEEAILYPNVPAEGIVARTEPLMLNREGERIIWKLKPKDFTPSKRSPD